jgi:hypothetical protein
LLLGSLWLLSRVDVHLFQKSAQQGTSYLERAATAHDA